jgi:AraC family transcriptional regulator of arabinose operon
MAGRYAVPEDGERLSDGFKHEQMFVLNAPDTDRFRALTGDSGLFLTDVGFYPDAAGHYRARPAGSSAAILLYVRKGRGIVQIPERTVRLSADEALVIPPGTPHIYFADREEPWSLFWVHAGGAALSGYLKSSGKRKLTGPGAAQRMEMYFEMIFQTLQEGLTDGNFRYLDRLLQTVFAEVFWREEADRTAGSNPVVSQIIRYFYRNLGRMLTLADLSEETGLSVSRISALFRKYTGSAPLVFFTRLKMERACYLLRTSTMNVGEVAQELGFADPYYFSRVFTRVVGQSPRAYRSSPV